MTNTLPSIFSYVTHEVRVVFGAASLTTLTQELDRAGFRRILLLTTPSRPAQRAAVTALLADRIAGEFTGAKLHVPVEVVREARAVLDRVQPEALLALGGGSAIGLGKALAFETKLPLAAVATTYSGSEMTAIWGLSDGIVKRTFRDAHAAPRLVLYDPDLTHDLPSSVSAPSGMNAIAHCVEAEYAPESNMVVQWFASEGIRRMSRALPVISTNPGDRAAREDALLGAHFAGRALDMTSMGLHHKLAHILGGSFGMPHAESHAALLPWVTAWNGAVAVAAMERIAAALGVEDAATGLADLSRRIGIKPLSELGFSRESIPRAVDLALGLSFPNPRKVEADGVRWILESALTGVRFQPDG